MENQEIGGKQFDWQQFIPEVMTIDFECFSEKKKHCIFGLSEDNRIIWVEKYLRLLSSKKDYNRLEDALRDAEKITDETYIKACILLSEKEKEIKIYEGDEKLFLDSLCGKPSIQDTGKAKKEYERKDSEYLKIRASHLVSFDN